MCSKIAEVRGAVLRQAQVGSTASARVLVPARDGGRSWVQLGRPAEVLAAVSADQVGPLLAQVEAAAAAGFLAVGYVAYEAAKSFDRALVSRPGGDLPLACFALFPEDCMVPFSWPAAVATPFPPLTPTLDAAGYAAAVASVKSAIARGDTYQVNFTYRLRGAFEGDPRALFQAMVERQPVPHAVYLDLGRFAICSASPELFFRLDGDRVCCRPMKGTAPRGRWAEEDADCARKLRATEKERAENLMIVDMVRSDLGRVARPGSVEVSRLYDTERYATLWQMTSTVEAESSASLCELFRALFPSASVTGAPKASSMALISELEDTPRGVYTGAVGWVGPGRQAELNVAIRTAVVDRARKTVEYGTGSGLVWDSVTDAEYAECHTKALVVLQSAPPWELLESLLWRPGRGYWLISEHLERLSASAAYFGVQVPGDLRGQLRRFASGLPRRRHKVRLLLAAQGEVRLEAQALPRRSRSVWCLAWASQAVDPRDPFLFHKTTRRHIYEAARRGAPGADDVLLWNPDGEVTEATCANLVARIDGFWLTPPRESGLLAGTLRARLLARGELTEAPLSRRQVEEAEALYLINSVRGWIPARLVDQGGPEYR